MAPAGGALAESRWSDVESSSSNVSQDASSSQTSQGTQATTNMHQKYDLEADIRTVAVYIVQSKASQLVQEAFDRIHDASTRVKGSTTEQAIRQLQDTVQKLST